MTPVVIDASAALGWLLRSQATAALREFSRRTVNHTLVAPECFRWEVRGVLLRRERSGHVRPGSKKSRLALLESRITFGSEPDEKARTANLDRIDELARTHGLSLFDASYLDLAQRMHAELASKDAKLLDVAARCGVAVRDLR